MLFLKPITNIQHLQMLSNINFKSCHLVNTLPCTDVMDIPIWIINILGIHGKWHLGDINASLQFLDGGGHLLKRL